MVRHTDVTMTAMKVPRNSRRKGHAGSRGEAPGLVGRQRGWGGGVGNMDESLYRGSPGKNGRGGVNRPTAAGVSNVSGLWGIGPVPAVRRLILG